MAEQQEATDFFGMPTPDEALWNRTRALMQRTNDPREQAALASEAAAIQRGERQHPQYDADRKTYATYQTLWQETQEKGLRPDKDPQAFADNAAAFFTRNNMPREAMLAMQWGQAQEALARAARLDEARIKSLEASAKGEGKGRGDYYVPVQTAEGVRAFDARRGVILDTGTKTPIKTPVVGSASDPKLQGDIAEAKEFGKDVGTAVAAVGGKYDALDSVRSARSILAKGIYSGFWGEMQQKVAKATPGADKTKAANTEEFMAYVGNTVIPRLKEFGGNDSNEELKFLQKVMGGEQTMEPKALAKILESAEKKIDAGIKRLRKQAGSTKGSLPAPEKLPALPAGWKVRTK